MRFSILTFLLCIFFSACSQKIYDEPKIPTFQTSDYLPLSINARKLVVIQNWKMPGEEPFNEHLILPNPSSVITEWASNTLLPAGSSGDLTLDIRRASIILQIFSKLTHLQGSLKITKKVR